MGKSKHFEVPEDKVFRITADKTSPDRAEVDDILASAIEGSIDPKDANKLLNVINAPDFPERRDQVLELAGDIRKSVFNGHVVPMAPIEVGNKCVSDCDFCGWRSDNSEMPRSRVPTELVKEQAKYLIDKGIHSIELVCGDDPVMVRDEFPGMIAEVRKLFPPNVKGRIQVCTMALTKKQYEDLKTAGADGIIVWQETYDKKVYDEHITRGPKARGITDDWKVVKGGDGFKFRLQSQDRALEAGLEVALGTMLGLNPDLSYEVISTILHARHLMERGVDEQKPLIVGMPTWNKITTPTTDRRPPDLKDPSAFFPYLAAVYFLALDKKKAWIFPNCRVPMETQIEALKAGGVFSSTEVKLGPAGYMPAVIEKARVEGDQEAIERITRLMSDHLGRDFHDLGQLQADLDLREQFTHTHHSHKEYKLAFHNAGLHVSPETTIKPERTLENFSRLSKITMARDVGKAVRSFLGSGKKRAIGESE